MSGLQLGKGIPSNLAMRSASRREDAAFASNLAKAFFTLDDGPLSRTDRGGGRKSNMSYICVARENMTYRFNHQSPVFYLTVI